MLSITSERHDPKTLTKLHKYFRVSKNVYLYTGSIKKGARNISVHVLILIIIIIIIIIIITITIIIIIDQSLTRKDLIRSSNTFQKHLIKKDSNNG